MAKKQVYSLISDTEAEDQYDFILIGLICQHKDYRLCYELNRKLEINLAKCDDYELFLTAHKTYCTFAKFRYKSPAGDDFVLLSNKGSRGTLLKEQHQLDFILKITEHQRPVKPLHQTPRDSYLKSIKDIPVILGAFALDPMQLGSREYLIME